MAECGGKNMLSVSALQACTLVKRYFPAGLSSNVVGQALQDPALLYLNLDELCEMDLDAVRALVCPAQDAQEAAGPGNGPEEEDAPEGTPPSTADECIVLEVDPEGLAARVTLIPPPDGVPAPGAREMLRALYRKKVTKGVRVEFINRLAERPIYDRPFRIAQAQPAINGQDGAVTFHFDTSADLSPRMAEDGTADYKNLDFVMSVQAGDLLCEITPATSGAEGVNIFGQPIPASAGRPPQVRCGANTALSQDGREIRAVCDGQVFLREGRVEVNQILMLDTVDFSTGNIDFPGSVHVRGDVANGFTVRAGGDIVVSGVVENATLISGGSIALCSGIKGGGSGVLEARQDVRTLFIESCKAKAGGNIYADTILNAWVECGRRVNVLGKRGYLLGGVCTAGDMITAVQIGNEANIPTTVALADRTGPSAEERQRAETTARYSEAADQLSLLAEQDAGGQERPLTFSCELARIAVLAQRLQQRIDQLQMDSGRPGRGRHVIQVLEALYPNVSLEIDGVSAKNTRQRGRCTILERRGQVCFSEDRA